MKNCKLEVIGTLLVSALTIFGTIFMFINASSYEQVLYAVIIGIVAIISIPSTFIMLVVLKKAFKEISK